ncbi:MAG: glycoside hydrolase family 20 zincin-like fold domain-containing protein, partial [Ktedonobacteraceae bacterium]
MSKRKGIRLTMILLSIALALLILVGRNLLAPSIFSTNPAPSVVPMLREWHGNNGFFLLNTDTQIVLDPLYADQLEETASVFQQDLFAETDLTVPIVVTGD